MLELDLPPLADARVEAIKAIWALLRQEQGEPLRLNRRVTISDDRGEALLVVTFPEAIAAVGTG